jgi:hypothetical protein
MSDGGSGIQESLLSIMESISAQRVPNILGYQDVTIQLLENKWSPAVGLSAWSSVSTSVYGNF